MVDSNSVELVREIRDKYSRILKWPIALAICILGFIGLVAMIPKIWVVALFGLGTIAVPLAIYFHDQLKKNVVLMYDLEDEMLSAYAGLFNSLGQIRRCSLAMNLGPLQGEIDAGRMGTIRRYLRSYGIGVFEHCPPYINTNVSVPCLVVGGMQLYFLPDQMLVYSRGTVGAIAYADFRVEVGKQSFREIGVAPQDAEVIGRQPLHVRKDGGADLRFKDNPTIYTVVYATMQLNSSSGFSLSLVISNRDVAMDIASSLVAMNVAVEAAKKAEEGRKARELEAERLRQLEEEAERRRLEAKRAFYEKFCDILSCFLIVDGTVTVGEREVLCRLMSDVKSGWGNAEIESRLAGVINEAKLSGMLETWNRLVSDLGQFDNDAKRRALVRSLEIMLRADKESAIKQQMFAKLKQVISA